MPQLPRDSAPDSTLALLSEGYGFISNRCRRHGSDIFETRLMLRKAVCMQGKEAARVFHSPGRFTRRGALQAPAESAIQVFPRQLDSHGKPLDVSMMAVELLNLRRPPPWPSPASSPSPPWRCTSIRSSAFNSSPGWRRPPAQPPLRRRMGYDRADEARCPTADCDALRGAEAGSAHRTVAHASAATQRLGHQPGPARPGHSSFVKPLALEPSNPTP